MLVATRDPVPQRGGHDAVRPAAAAHQSSRMSRLMFAVQLSGSLLAIPVGLASAYSIYRANFAPETACQTLRTNIIAMIDKQIDASTRRMLVRRDVEEFEKSCGGVDPDAGAAFKSLLAAAPPPQLRPAADAMPASEWRQTEPAPKRVKESRAKDAKDAKDVKEHEARVPEPSSDARWLNEVRNALTAHEMERAAAEKTVKPLMAPAPLHSTAVPVPATASVPIAPALPPPSTVSERAAPKTTRAADHPVPPGSIPDSSDVEPVSTGSAPPKTSWTDHLPFIGR